MLQFYLLYIPIVRKICSKQIEINIYSFMYYS